MCVKRCATKAQRFDFEKMEEDFFEKKPKSSTICIRVACKQNSDYHACRYMTAIDLIIKL